MIADKIYFNNFRSKFQEDNCLVKRAVSSVNSIVLLSGTLNEYRNGAGEVEVLLTITSAEGAPSSADSKI